jgi:hypothetical protein
MVFLVIRAPASTLNLRKSRDNAVSSQPPDTVSCTRLRRERVGAVRRGAQLPKNDRGGAPTERRTIALNALGLA